MQFVYLYFMKEEPERVRAAVPQHAAYWRGLGLPGYQGGPFDDRSGGLVRFDSDTRESAEQMVIGDPFLRADLVSSWWLKVWMPE